MLSLANIKSPTNKLNDTLANFPLGLMMQLGVITTWYNHSVVALDSCRLSHIHKTLKKYACLVGINFKIQNIYEMLRIVMKRHPPNR